MRVAFRVDASPSIGTGHAMRCLTLAKELKGKGVETTFLSRHMPDYLGEIVTGQGHALCLLPSGSSLPHPSPLAHSSWLGVSQESDASATIESLSGHVDWLVVDHYALDATWESMIRPITKNILVIDDLADRRHDCDLLLDQNYYSNLNDRYQEKVPGQCRKLLGPRFALLREEFRDIRGNTNLRGEDVKRILVYFGGVDQKNYTSLAVDILVQLGYEVSVDVVIGRNHPSRAAIEEACLRHGFNCHVQTDHIARLMAAADLCIGAGGTAVWERCCLGLPTLAISCAQNQYIQLTDAASAGFLYHPQIGTELRQQLERHIQSVIENPALRQLISKKGLDAVDAAGTMRVINAMGVSGIELRKANPLDMQSLFEWRNHPDIRAVSKNPDQIPWDEHVAWFRSMASDPSKILLIGEVGGDPAGVLKFEAQGTEAEVSIYLVPGRKKTISGQELLQQGEAWLKANSPRIEKLNAHVLGFNKPSLNLFFAAGYDVQVAHYSKRLH